MSNINDSTIRQTTVTQPSTAPVTEKQEDKKTTPEGTTTKSDLDGVKKKQPEPEPKPISTITVPSYVTGNTESEVLAALEKVSAKAPDIQKAVAEAAAALGALNAQAGKFFAANILDGMVNSVINAAKNDLGGPFGQLYSYLGKGVDELLAEAPENVPLKTAADSARTIMDLLEKPGSDENTAAIAKAMADLAKLTLITEKSTDDQKMAAALAATLYNVLSIAGEADVLGDNLTKVLNEIKVSFPMLAVLPDAVAASGRLTNQAVLGLTMLLTAKVQQEIAARLETKDDESRKVQELQDKKLNIQQLLNRDMERTDQVNLSKVVSSSAIVAALAQCGDIGEQIINALMLMHQVDSVPRNPV